MLVYVVRMNKCKFHRKYYSFGVEVCEMQGGECCFGLLSKLKTNKISYVNKIDKKSVIYTRAYIRNICLFNIKRY